jgi:Major Facilitator Superfamily
MASTDAPSLAGTTSPPPSSHSSSSLSSFVDNGKSQPCTPQQVLQRGARIAAASLGLLFVSYSLTLPHQQARRDALGCDALCLGTVTSARSFLKLLGSVVMGRVSDSRRRSGGRGGDASNHGCDERGARSLPRLFRNAQYSARKLCLGVGVLSAGVALLTARRAESVSGLWWSLLPEAFEQNMHISKALMGEYQTFPAITSAERAAASGALGSAVGVAMMVGPLLGSYLTYDQAVGLALLVLCLSVTLVVLLPVAPNVPSSNLHPQHTDADSLPGSVDQPTPSPWWRLLDVPSARSPPALFVLVCRLLSTTAYHIYQTMLTVSLRERFNFTPMEYGQFFSCIGLFFALSQSVMAKFFLQRMAASSASQAPSRESRSKVRQNRARVRLLVTCSILITITRYVGYRTRSVPAVYTFFAIMVSAYGVMSTLIAADTAQIAAPNELGSFFGLLAAVESGAGMVGPLVGGALNSLGRVDADGGATATNRSSSSLPASLWAVIILNLLGTAMLALGYERIVLAHINRSAIERSSLKDKHE